METIKLEKTEIIDVIDSEADTESPSLSEDSESSYDHLKQTGFQICTEDYAGHFKFDFFLDGTEIPKKHWMYSPTLNKVFIDMDRVLPIQFQWQFDHMKLVGIKNVRIRALPIFTNPEFQQLSIKRCPVHSMQDKISDSKRIKHLLWCEQSDAIYEEDLNSQRYSVVVNVHNSSPCSYSTVYNVLYRFMCKSSCNLSLNRRPIYVIFTLETLQGQVLGRKKLGVKICSCPRRDMLREEDFEKNIVAGMTMIKKRTLPDNDNSILKKILKSNNENNQNAIYELPAFPIPGKRLYLSTLELLHSHILGSAVREDRIIDSHPTISMFAELISQIKSEINNHVDDNNTDSNTDLTEIKRNQML